MLKRRHWILSVALVGLAASLWWLATSQRLWPAMPVLIIEPVQASGGASEARPGVTNLVADDLRQKLDPPRREAFRVVTTRGTSLFVLATGVQVQTISGWQTLNEEHRNEIWRLSPRIAHEVCVERPEGAVWRVFVRYGSEMKGLPLLRAQLKEAWATRNFSNWSGQAWGGGRWSGAYEFFGAPVRD